jgi:hypothetical protein
VRLPFPERVPIDRVALFAIALFVVQWLEGTPLYFRFGCVVFILIAAFAFNTAGGLTRASGVYIFFYSTLVVIVGVCYKAFLGEPAQSNLLDPRTDIKVYVGGITAMLAAIIVSSRLRRKSGLLQNVLKESQMYRASVGCMLFGLLGASVLSVLGTSEGSLESAFLQLNQLMPLGIIIGVMYEIRRSGGTRSINLPTLLVAGYYFLFYGLINFSKQGMLMPLVCWFFPVCALRFRLSVLQVLSVFAVGFLVFYYLVPYSQYGRSLLSENQTASQRVELAVRLLGHPSETRSEYENIAETGGLNSYYNTPQGFWERLEFVSVDDRLIDVADHGKSFGLLPIKAEFVNAIPHSLWRDKPNINFGNMYAHQLGALSEEDTSTGVSFSPTAEAYFMDRWVGVLVIAPLLWFLLFVVYDSLFGDLRATPWGLLAVALISHTAPESALTGVIHSLTFGSEVLIFCALFTTWIAPFFAIPVLGPDRRGVAPQTSFRSSFDPRITPGTPGTGSAPDSPA